uniref:Putative secreted protein n=1 Tax=Anopheles marajoara TaxID=58244 RepID=A0A2M4CCS9_9DIPT
MIFSQLVLLVTGVIRGVEGKPMKCTVLYEEKQNIFDARPCFYNLATFNQRPSLGAKMKLFSTNRIGMEVFSYVLN